MKSNYVPVIKIGRGNMETLNEVKELECAFKVQYHWEADQLIFECPTKAARDYMARVLDEGPMIVKVKRRA